MVFLLFFFLCLPLLPTITPLKLQFRAQCVHKEFTIRLFLDCSENAEAE